MKQLLHFIDQYVQDDQLYWQAVQLNTGARFEVQWRRDHAQSWRLKPLEAVFWNQYDANNFLLTLVRGHIDINDFEASLRQTVLQQAVYANLICEAAKELLGEDVYHQAVIDNGNFLAEIQATVDSLNLSAELDELGVTKPPLRLVRPEEEDV